MTTKKKDDGSEESQKTYLMKFDTPAKNAVAMMFAQMMPLHLALGIESGGVFFILGKQIDLLWEIMIDQDEEGIFIVTKSSFDM